MGRRRLALKEFYAIDGESFTEGESHNYVLMMGSDGAKLFNGQGLDTKECFEWLLSLPKNYIHVAFGLNYDVNMMLKDLGRKRLQELWEYHRCYWFDYSIDWMPGKWFAVKKGKNRIRVTEVFGIFQSSFVKALDGWGIEHQDADQLEEMKASRSTFDESIQAEIEAYCLTETKLLVELMTRTRENFHVADIRPSAWHGAGAAAQAMLRSKGVKKHHVSQTDWSMDVQKACMHAYFGGRTELFLQGEFPVVSQYDFISAYPSIALELPSLTGGSWSYESDYIPEAKYAIWEVEWAMGDSEIVSPFPFRYKGTRICYPRNGHGYYHASEVKAASGTGACIRTLGGWVYTLRDAVPPFAFIQDTFAERARLKAEGHAAHKVLKLAINSLYGKLAQGVGYRGKLPAYQNFFWAGFITAGTRARLLSLMVSDHQNLIMVATDGIFFRGGKDSLPTGTGLGELEKSMIFDMFTAQPGVYHGWKDGNEIRRSRGFFAKEIDFQSLRAGFRRRGSSYIGHYTSTRFHGLGTSLQSRNMEKWRKWETGTRKLSLYPSTKVVQSSTSRVVQHMPPQGPGGMSAPYTPKVGGYTEDELDFAQGKDQPLRS